MGVTQQTNMELKREQVNALIQAGQKKGFTGKEIIDGLVRKGYQPEGVNVEAIKSTFVQQAPVTEEKPSLGQKLKTSLDTRVERTGDILARQDSSTFEKGAQVFGQGAGLAADVIEKTAGQIPGVSQALEGMSKGIQWLSQTAPIKALGSKIGDSKALQEAVTLYDTDENFRDSVDAVANVARLGGDVAAVEQAVNFTKNVTSKLGQSVKEFGKSITPDDGGGAGGSLQDDIQLAIAKKNVNPQLESSTKRLFLDGTKNIDNPLKTYDSYLAQSKKAITDIKTDPAISVVGEKMGNAFQKVVKQRQAVGKVLGDELKTNGKIKVNISEPKTSLLSELKDSGLSYNPKTNRLTSFQGSKFAPDEVKILNDFVKGVAKLGDTPTVAQIDNFIAKTRATLQFTKGKSGVIGTTNAERIINGGISKLRATLDPAVNGNSALSKYWKANKTYSELSDFVDEGSTFLGKKTLTGDFAKDASVAKSSVQSILNQGKKDFMIKLEQLTGYKAIDDAVLALQAMKDAGDFRGLSLLQAMSETGIPTSKAGFTQKIIDAAIKKGGEIIAGTPEEQTRAFLQDLLKNEKIANPKTTTPTTIPRVGATASKINQTKKSVIPKSSPKSTTKSMGIFEDDKLASTADIGKKFDELAKGAKTTKSSLKGKGVIPETNLINEAKKYKSAEEFVKAQGTPVYHGTSKEALSLIEKGGFKKGKAGDWGAGIYTTKNKISADMYGDTFGGKTIEAFIPENKIYEYKDFFLNKDKASLDLAKKIIANKNVPETLKSMNAQELADRIKTTFSTENPAFWLEKAGYKGIKDSDRIVSQIKDEIMIFSPDTIKTKSQLEEIWKKANSKANKK